MVLLMQIISSKQGVCTGTTKAGNSVVLESVACPNAVFGLNEGDDAQKAFLELQKTAEANEAKYYLIGEIKLSEDKKIFAIPYSFYFK